MSTYVDLSVPLNESTPVYPGDPTFQAETAGVLNADGWNDHKLTLATHIGTHIDAPFHMIKDGKTLDKFPLETFIGQGVVIDVRDGFNTVEIADHRLSPGMIVLFHTGWSERSQDPAYYTAFEPVPMAIADWLVEQKVKMVGFDMSGPDMPPFPIHKRLLDNDILIMENLTNLASLPPQGFYIYALPLNLALDGAPARVIAVLD